MTGLCLLPIERFRSDILIGLKGRVWEENIFLLVSLIWAIKFDRFHGNNGLKVELITRSAFPRKPFALSHSCLKLAKRIGLKIYFILIALNYENGTACI